MPITENGYEYQMPDGIRNQLTKEFLSELHKSVTGWYKVMHGMTGDEFTYHGFYVHVVGNGVWSDSFRSTAANGSKHWLGEYYGHLPWYESDIFDGIVTDIMVELGVIEEGEGI